jgi:CheY-like chemotaxis protein
MTMAREAYHDARPREKTRPDARSRSRPCFPSWVTTIPGMQTVLVVDDDRELAGVLADALKELGFRVECAHDGEGALRHIGQQRPAAIILDLLMPRMDGLAFLGSRREDQAMAEIPVIVLSGERRMTARARAVGADLILEKPVKLLLLLEAIERVLDRKPDA